jgi:protein-tyrosine-phosphatase
MNVLLVCSGNTCRSPLAEGMLRARLRVRGLDGITVASAGTGASEGAPASEGSYLVGLELGIDLSAHRSRALTPELTRSADLILTMSRSHRERVRDLGAGDRVHLLGEYAGFTGAAAEVPDPYGGELGDYRATHDRLAPMLDAVAERLVRERAGGQR